MTKLEKQLGLVIAFNQMKALLTVRESRISQLESELKDRVYECARNEAEISRLKEELKKEWVFSINGGNA